MTNEELIQKWIKYLTSIKRRKGTIVSYEGTINMFSEFLMDKSLLDVTKHDIRSFLTEEKGHLAKATLNRLFATISSFYYWAEDEDLVEDHPMPSWRGRPTVKWENSKIEYLNEKEKEIVHNYFAKKKNPRDMMIYNFMLGTGARVSDILVAKAEDIDWETPGVGLFGKGEKYRYVPIREELAKALEKYLDEKEIKSGYIFRNRKRGQLSQSYIGWTFDQAQEATKIKKLHPHIVRHTFATDFIANGGSLADLKEILGHSSITTTAIYPRIIRENLIKSVKMYSPEVFVE